MVLCCEQSSRACQHRHNFYISDVIIQPNVNVNYVISALGEKKITLGMQSLYSCSYIYIFKYDLHTD